MAKKTPEETDPKKSVSHLPTLKKIGKIVEAARKQKGWSVATLQKNSNVSNVWIDKLEKGVMNNASLSTLYDVTESLGLKIELSIEFKP